MLFGDGSRFATSRGSTRLFSVCGFFFALGKQLVHLGDDFLQLLRVSFLPRPLLKLPPTLRFPDKIRPLDPTQLRFAHRVLPTICALYRTILICTSIAMAAESGFSPRVKSVPYFAAAASGSTITNFPIDPLSTNLIRPVILAKSVSSLPRPTFSPGFTRVPRCRTMIVPPGTSCPPKALNPSRCAFESRPFREVPCPFLCAINQIPCGRLPVI